MKPIKIILPIILLGLLASCGGGGPITKDKVLATGISQGLTQAAPIAYAQALTQIANGGTPVAPVKPTEFLRFLLTPTPVPTATLPPEIGSISVGDMPIPFFERPGEDATYLGDLLDGNWVVVEKAAVGQYYRIIIEGYLERNDIQTGFGNDFRTACITTYLDSNVLTCNAHLLDGIGSTSILARIQAGAVIALLHPDPSGGSQVRLDVWVKAADATFQPK